MNAKPVQWYPGHMFKAKKEIITQLKNIDLVVEVIDARVPLSSHNEMLDELTQNKDKLLIFSKIDMVDQNKLTTFMKHYEELGYTCVAANLKNTAQSDMVLKKIYAQSENIKAKFAKKGINKTVRILVMGMPNVGKSTLINFLSKKKKTEVGNRPGVTKQQQWISVADDIELLDTPGILVPKIENQLDGYKLVLCSLIKDEVVVLEDVAVYLIERLFYDFPTAFKQRYEIQLDEYDVELIYNQIAKNIGALQKGNEYDYDRVTKALINDFRNLKLGKILLDEIR